VAACLFAWEACDRALEPTADEYDREQKDGADDQQGQAHLPAQRQPMKVREYLAPMASPMRTGRRSGHRKTLQPESADCSSTTALDRTESDNCCLTS
jgi:hypothetical protein